VQVRTVRRARGVGDRVSPLRVVSTVVVLIAIAAACSGRGHVARSVPSSSLDVSTVAWPVRVATDSRRAVRDARLVRPLLFDGAALRLDVGRGSPRVDEAHAITLFRAGSVPSTTVESVTVVYAVATLRLPVKTEGIVIQPRVVPAFERLPVWAFIWSNGPHGCPAQAASTGSVALPEPQHVELIAADGSDEGVSYQTRGSPCGGPITAPHAEVAAYYISLPWSASSITSTARVVRYPAPPPCGDIEYTPRSGNASGMTFGVYAIVLMARPPCSTPPQPTSTARPVAAGVVLLHDRTGLSLGRFTAAAHFTYFDGRSHTTT
jgi:hypothetical protein